VADVRSERADVAADLARGFHWTLSP